MQFYAFFINILRRIQNNAKSTVEDYVVGRDDDMRDLIDRAVAGYDMVSLYIFSHEITQCEIYKNVGR